MSSSSWVIRENITDINALAHLARLSERAERYQDMAACMKLLAEHKKRLDNEERNLLYIAYNNLLKTHRFSHRIINDMAGKDSGAENAACKELRTKVEQDFETICFELLDVLLKTLLPNNTDNTAEIFYKKMEGDYRRYLAESQTGSKREEEANKALAAYEEATTKANNLLSKTNSIRLGLALNFAVFYYEILENYSKACEIAKTAFEEAIANLDEIERDSNKDTAVILQLLRDNLTIWTSDREFEK